VLRSRVRSVPRRLVGSRGRVGVKTVRADSIGVNASEVVFGIAVCIASGIDERLPRWALLSRFVLSSGEVQLTVKAAAVKLYNEALSGIRFTISI
jgi:hypothetical protein